MLLKFWIYWSFNAFQSNLLIPSDFIKSMWSEIEMVFPGFIPQDILQQNSRAYGLFIRCLLKSVFNLMSSSSSLIFSGTITYLMQLVSRPNLCQILWFLLYMDFIHLPRWFLENNSGLSFTVIADSNIYSSM